MLTGLHDTDPSIQKFTYDSIVHLGERHIGWNKEVSRGIRCSGRVVRVLGVLGLLGLLGYRDINRRKEMAVLSSSFSTPQAHT